MAIAATLVALMVAPSLMAQGGARQVTERSVVFRGTTSLTTPKPSQTTGAGVAMEIDSQAASKTRMGPAPQSPTVAPSGPTMKFSNGGALLTFNGIDAVQSRSVNDVDVEPPDQGLCVGNGFVVEINNIAIEVFDGNGNLLQGPTSEYDFWLLPHNHLPIGDGRCYYDIADGRFFLTMLDVDASNGRSHLEIAVSNDNNVLHGFGMFQIDTTDDGTDGTPLHANCPCFGDQPLVGADAFGFYISTNEFPIFVNGYDGAQIYAMSKPLLEGFVLGKVVQINGLTEPFGGFSVQPATAPGVGAPEPAGGTEFLLESRDIIAGTSTLGVFAITNTSSLANATPNLAVLKKIVTVEPFTIPPDAPQAGGSTLRGHPERELITGDDRMQQTVFAGGILQGALTTGFDSGPNFRSAIAYFAFRPAISGGVLSATRVKQGYVAGAPGLFLFYPALAVNANNQGIIGLGLSGPFGNFSPLYPSAGFVRYSGHTGAYGPGFVSALGAAPEDGFSCYATGTSHCRWGDYSAAAPDDLNPGQIWFATQYISGVERTPNANWATSISVVGVP
jgi:hypothetical protein